MQTLTALTRYQNRLDVAGAAPVSLNQAKSHLNLPPDSTFHDEEVQALLDAATKLASAGAEVAIGSQYTLALWDFPCNSRDERLPGEAIVPPRQPLVSVEKVDYLDAEGVNQEFLDFKQILDGPKGYIIPSAGNKWPEEVADPYPENIVIQYTSGKANPVAKVAILQLVAHWFDTRSSVVTGAAANEVPMATAKLLANLSWGNEFEVLGI